MRALYASTLKQPAILLTLRETGICSGNMTGNTDLPVPEPPVRISTGTDLAADRSQEIILEQLHQVMGMLDRTRIPARMAP